MTDFIREVEEEYRRDKAIEAWRKYQNWIIGAAILIVVAAGGWRFYEYQRRQAAEAAGARFEAAVQLVRENKGKEAEQAFLQIAQSGPKGYAVLARFRAAAEIAGRDPAEAVKVYEALAGDAAVNPVLQNVARLRAAMLRVDEADQAEMRQRVEGLAAPTSAFRHSARELLGLSALRAGDYEAAGRWFDMIVADPQAPQGLRERAGTMLGLVAAGAPNVGSGSAAPAKAAPADAAPATPAPTEPAPVESAPAAPAPATPAPETPAPERPAPAAETPAEPVTTPAATPRETPSDASSETPATAPAPDAALPPAGAGSIEK